MEAEIAEELEAASVEMTPAAPVVDEAANARRLAVIKEREAQVAAMKMQPTPIAATNKTINSDKRAFFSDSDGDDDDDKDDDDFLGLKRREPEALFELRPEFAGADGKRLFEMQKRCGGDQRFRLDARLVKGDELNDGAWATLTPDAGEVAKRAYIAETELSLVFANMELERAKTRLHRSVSDAKDLKQLGWLAAVRRYDPRDVDAKALEQTVPTNAAMAKDSDDDGKVLPPMPVQKETSMPEDGEEMEAAGEEMEAALDGIVKPAAAVSTGFSFASMLGDVIEDDGDDHVDAKPLEETPDLDKSTWLFANTVRKVVQADSTGDEAMEDDEANDEPVMATVALPKRQVADVLAFVTSFCKPDPWPTHEVDWMSLRKTLTFGASSRTRRP
ncbi:hypothetical protein SPRG_16083 [Saprolegnia parasitica CBS 223.65]|uniref:Uncharacterized protein n=1 Tax=Saprolegnia parasitica (strain CBS 223.65) TaxID=695850 RepID=A0A067BK08_SAPPC|nr:hypothetical protein SPRG_16083 [Saprolegnia parasitica CBS 223.65]KDO18528.1 hypothetical protein SPRG_16083 [Saprolegnia parasitica CBS 223.65]|eukprot:XP_012210763.1 hypothetical protein SPRG_16083 [Saprolegnia parasitica CBS 223.65]